MRSSRSAKPWASRTTETMSGLSVMYCWRSISVSTLRPSARRFFSRASRLRSNARSVCVWLRRACEAFSSAWASARRPSMIATSLAIARSSRPRCAAASPSAASRTLLLWIVERSLPSDAPCARVTRNVSAQSATSRGNTTWGRRRTDTAAASR